MLQFSIELKTQHNKNWQYGMTCRIPWQRYTMCIFCDLCVLRFTASDYSFDIFIVFLTGLFSYSSENSAWILRELIKCMWILYLLCNRVDQQRWKFSFDQRISSFFFPAKYLEINRTERNMNVLGVLHSIGYHFNLGSVVVVIVWYVDL